MAYKVLVAALSDVGLVRQNNEDAWKQLPDEFFYVLADGMGGHRAGEVASKRATEQLCLRFKEAFDHTGKTLEDAKEVLFKSIQEVSQSIYTLGCSKEELHGMGTTLCSIYLHPRGLVYGHVGDSRIYMFHQKVLRQLTRDHSLLRELRDLGQIEEDDSEGFLYKNILTRAVGTEPYVEPCVESVSLHKGDIILMCSDGLTDMLSEKEIQEIIKSNPMEKVAKALVKAAKQQGGTDNITVVVVKIEEKNESEDLSR